MRTLPDRPTTVRSDWWRSVPSGSVTMVLPTVSPDLWRSVPPGSVTMVLPGKLTIVNDTCRHGPESSGRLRFCYRGKVVFIHPAMI